MMRHDDVGRPLGLRDRTILEIFYSCALRRQELIELTVRDVDFERGTLFVRCGKGAKDRYVMFTPDELKALEEEATQTVEITEFVPIEKRSGLTRQWHDVFLPTFHAFRWDAPLGSVKIDFRPLTADYLAFARGVQNDEPNCNFPL